MTIIKFIAFTIMIGIMFSGAIVIAVFVGREYFGVNALERRVEALEQRESGNAGTER